MLCLPVFFALGWVIQARLIRPVLHAPENIQILVTVGISLVLQNMALFLFSPDFQSLRLSYGATTFSVAGVSVSYVRLIACAVSLSAAVGVFLFLSRTDTGKALRACAEEQTGAMVGRHRCRAHVQDRLRPRHRLCGARRAC